MRGDNIPVRAYALRAREMTVLTVGRNWGSGTSRSVQELWFWYRVDLCGNVSANDVRRDSYGGSWFYFVYSVCAGDTEVFS